MKQEKNKGQFRKFELSVLVSNEAIESSSLDFVTNVNMKDIIEQFSEKVKFIYDLKVEEDNIKISYEKQEEDLIILYSYEVYIPNEIEIIDDKVRIIVHIHTFFENKGDILSYGLNHLNSKIKDYNIFGDIQTNIKIKKIEDPYLYRYLLIEFSFI